MPHLVVDEVVGKKLRETSEPIEIRDADGVILGLFEPGMSEPDRTMLSHAGRAYLEELQRRASDRTGARSTIEVFERLLSLATDEPTRADLEARIAAIRERDRCVTP